MCCTNAVHAVIEKQFLVMFKLYLKDRKSVVRSVPDKIYAHRYKLFWPERNLKSTIFLYATIFSEPASVIWSSFHVTCFP